MDNLDYGSLESVADVLVGSESNPTISSLPSLDGIVAVAKDLCDLFFPGYGRSRHSHGEERFADCVRLLRHIEARLRLEIGRAVEADSRLTLRVHSASTQPNSSNRQQLTDQFLAALPRLKDDLQKDVSAGFDGDPAAKTPAEIVLCYPGLKAVATYRIAHELHNLGIPYLPRMLSEWAHRETGIDIHPGASIGPRFFIDHGTGVVIGETCVIGSGVTLYQGVTLGAWSFPRDAAGNLIRDQKRHPTLEDNVTVYSNATILGGDTVIGSGSLIGSSVTLSRSIPSRTVVTIEKPSLNFRAAS